MSEHTPGPWKIFEGWGADKSRPIIVDSVPDVDGKFVGNCICYMASTNPDMDANARLIKAAPEMLQTLFDVCLYLGRYADDDSNQLWAKISGVIGKAKGE